MFRSLIIAILSIVAVAIYLMGIVLAIVHSFPLDNPTPGLMPELLLWFISAAGALLATNLGSILGIDIPQGGLRYKRMTLPEIFRGSAAVLYLLCSLVALIAWWKAGFIEDPERIVSVLPELGRVFPGILIAALAVALGVGARSRSMRIEGVETAEEGDMMHDACSAAKQKAVLLSTLNTLLCELWDAIEEPRTDQELGCAFLTFRDDYISAFNPIALLCTGGGGCGGNQIYCSTQKSCVNPDTDCPVCEDRAECVSWLD